MSAEETAAVRQAADDFYSAPNILFTGDVAPMESVWSHRDDVTYMGPNDPLQACMDHVADNLIHDPRLCRTLPKRMKQCGFEIWRRDAHPYLAEGEAACFLTLISRGADFMANDGLLSPVGAEALKAEARNRVKEGSFFGFISFNSVIARRPS
ncbi:MAG: hypothetical protein GY798_24685 [Hyphomicrobiales bacterium]|nr:hypothetical protein [Hyphomicrobiales bacterium]